MFDPGFFGPPLVGQMISTALGRQGNNRPERYYCGVHGFVESRRDGGGQAATLPTSSMPQTVWRIEGPAHAGQPKLKLGLASLYDHRWVPPAPASQLRKRRTTTSFDHGVRVDRLPTLVTGCQACRYIWEGVVGARQSLFCI